MRDAVCLASGGLDSTVCLALLLRSGIRPLPLFINYGQINANKEYASLQASCEKLDLGPPLTIDLRGYGTAIKSGLTEPTLDIVGDAFTPCRNLLFIVMAAAVANQNGITKIVLGLLTEATMLFPDQSDRFLLSATRAVSDALGVEMEIVVPLREFHKADVVRLAGELNVKNHYSCHAGTTPPCGVCIACKEYEGV
ncbi:MULTISPECIES: 7-cyano-7-deazaguanine synthase [unclassified Mesorhizobium]|uniref:7-cyano-7-deazaguanine synthase n=1 Tax=unclassified Mesorhizobium TaxID=325217 RepID=UPI0015E2FA91|nr:MULTISPECIES: 7-cyano-7-deazaguanine synthase [unclassified Mesorhizobium]